MSTKVCSKCNEEKNVSKFSKASSAKDGLRSSCKLCDKITGDAYRIKHKDKIAQIRTTEEYKLYMKAYASTDKCKLKQREYKENNADKVRAAVNAANAAAYATPEGKARLNANADRYKATPGYKEKRAEIGRKYQKTEKGILVRRQSTRSYRARKLNAVGSHTEEEVIEILHLQKCKCAICKKSLKKGYHVDHIVALSKGGSDYKDNLQMLCPTCNLKKSAKDPIKFMQSKGYLI